MKKTLLILLISFNTAAFAQVGIGTTTPHNSAILDVSATDKGIIFPKMTSPQRTSIASPADGLHVYDTDTKSLWYYNGSFWVNTQAMATVGDVKSGMQIADHSGWVKLDGRAFSALTTTQQKAALSLGFTTNLPNATDAYPVQKTGIIGAVSGSNSTTLSQSNLPNVNFSGSTNFIGAHAHTYSYFAEFESQGWYSSSTSGNWGYTSVPTNGWSGYRMTAEGGAASATARIRFRNELRNTSEEPSHSHSVSVSSGGSGTAFNIAPRSLTVNMFIYLGL